jgi:hypothetical protein
MRRLWTSLAAATALALAAPALQAATPPPAPAVARNADVDRLMDAMLDESLLVAAMNLATDKQFDDMAVSDASFAALVKQFPGLDGALRTRTRFELAAIVHEGLPSLRASVAKLIMARMNGEQVVAAVALLGSPTGKAFYTKGMQLGATGKSKADVDEAELMKMLKPADFPLLVAFHATGADDAFVKLTPELSQISTDWGTDIVAKNKDRLSKAGIEATSEYMAKAAAQKGTTS